MLQDQLNNKQKIKKEKKMIQYNKASGNIDECGFISASGLVIPVPPEAIGNWIPNYPLPTSFLHATIIDFLCCYDACNGECFGDTEGLSGSDGQTPVGGDTGSTGGVSGVVKPRKRRK